MVLSIKLVTLVMLVQYVDSGDTIKVYNFGFVNKAGKVSNAGAVGRLWRHNKG